jgi:hypothetical protein
MELVRHINRFQEVSWNWNSLSLHPSVNLQVLKKLRDKPWNWYLLTHNPKFVWMWVQEFPDSKWDWNRISKSDLFTWNWVREFPKAHWNWNLLSDKILSVETIKEFPDASWNWYKMTLGPVITVNEMVETPNFPWMIEELLFVDVDEEIVRFLRFFRSHYDEEAWQDHTSRAPWNIIIQNMDLPWNLFFVRLKSTDTLDTRLLYERGSEFDWNHLSEVLNFSTVISMCPDLPWNFAYVSRNPSVTYKDVISFPTMPWDYNSVRLDRDRLEWNSANTIKKFWKRCVTDPVYQMCRKVVLGHLMSISVGGHNICEDECHTKHQNTFYS